MTETQASLKLDRSLPKPSPDQLLGVSCYCGKEGPPEPQTAKLVPVIEIDRADARYSSKLFDIIEVSPVWSIQLSRMPGRVQKMIQEMLPWRIPGQGVAYPSCGATTGYHACPGKDSVIPIRRHCDRPDCPKCWGYWAHRTVAEACRRLEVMAYFTGNDPRHFIFSVPVDEMDRPFKALRKSFKRRLRRWGMKACVVIYHPARFRSRASGEIVEWHECSLNPRALDRIDSVMVWAPHFHVIGFGYLIGSTELEKKTGWIYKNKREVRTAEGVKRLLCYLASHAGVRKGVKIVGYGGNLYGRYFKIYEQRLSKELVACAKCGSTMRAKTLSGEDKGPATKRAKERRYLIVTAIVGCEYGCLRSPGGHWISHWVA